MNQKELLDIAARLGRVGVCIRQYMLGAMQVSKLGRQIFIIIIKTQKNDL